jgi:glycosyltransferase involved in cell wall biosynthesis
MCAQILSNPVLSVIIPMRGGVSQQWLEELLKVEGDVEFILTYPPTVKPFPITEPRLRYVRCPLQGEVVQRITALLNATGQYVLSINCDEYLHPRILEIVTYYFERFPESYFFRLRQGFFPFGDAPTNKPWEMLPNLHEIPIKNIQGRQLQNNLDERVAMREIPIAPLNNTPDLRSLLRGRRDHQGPHQENFDKKVWKNALVQETLKDIVPNFNLLGPLKYAPFWTADRLMGLAVQAKFYDGEKIIGHWLPLPEQMRTEDNPPDQPRNNRRYILADIILLKLYPKFGYLWNLAFSKGGILMIWFPKDTLKALAIKLKLFKPRSTAS